MKYSIHCWENWRSCQSDFV